MRSAADDKWRSDYGGSPDNSRYSPSKHINKANVGHAGGRVDLSVRRNGVQPDRCCARVIYGRGRNGALVALDAKTGQEIWIHEGMQAMSARGMNYWESKDGKDRRLIFTMNDYLQEIDARPASRSQTFGTDGVVDLREGLGRDPATIGRIQSGTPGKIFENLILLGSATGEGYMSPPGDLRAYDVITGTLVWQFHTVPHPGEFGYETWPKDACKYIGGANTWGEITVDAERGIAYFPTGSPTYDYYGADRIGANLFGNCLLALDARTGKRLWHFQIVHHDLWDFDNNAAPQLTRIRHNGRNVDVVAHGGQDRIPLRLRSRHRRADLADRGTSRAEEPRAGRAVLADAAVPDQAAAFRQAVVHRDDINPLSDRHRRGARSVQEAPRRRAEHGTVHADRLRRHACTCPAPTAARCSATPPRSRPGNVYVVAQDNPGVLKLMQPQQPGAVRRASPSISAIARRATAPIAAVRETGPTLLTLAGRVDAAAFARRSATARAGCRRSRTSPMSRWTPWSRSCSRRPAVAAAAAAGAGRRVPAWSGRGNGRRADRGPPAAGARTRPARLPRRGRGAAAVRHRRLRHDRRS